MVAEDGGGKDAAVEGVERVAPAEPSSGVRVSTPGDGVVKASTAADGALDPDLADLMEPSEFSVTAAIGGPGPGFMAASYEGPLPPPSYLKGYNDLVPGSAKEIISWVKHESLHRRRMELAEAAHRQTLETEESLHRRKLENRAIELGDKALGWGIFRANVGMFLAWPLVIGIVGVGAYLIHEGKGTYGIILVESGLAIVVGAFVLQKLERLIRPGKGQEEKPEEGKGSDE